MRSLANKTNVVPPDADYPFGRIKDNPGNNTGTPINELVYGDFHQFFEKLMAESGITPNELPDNEYSGFQLYEALIELIKVKTKFDTIQFVIDGGGSVFTAGQKGHVEVPFNCEVIGVRMYGNTSSGSTVIDIWKSDYASFPPVVGGSITAAAKPTLSAVQKSEDLTLTGWTTTLNRGDVLAYNVDSNTTKGRVTIVLLVEKTGE